MASYSPMLKTHGWNNLMLALLFYRCLVTGAGNKFLPYSTMYLEKRKCQKRLIDGKE